MLPGNLHAELKVAIGVEVSSSFVRRVDKVIE
jgi:hypothetical protein